MKIKILLLLLTLLSSLCACSKKGSSDSDDLPALKPVPVSQSVSPATDEIKAEQSPKYVYPYAQKRDPFASLIDEVKTGISADSSAKSGTGSGSFISLQLKGIMRSSKGKLALIESTDGEPYILKSGRIYNKENKKVTGVTGVIKEKSVVLISQDKIVRVLDMGGENAGSATGGAAPK